MCYSDNKSGKREKNGGNRSYKPGKNLRAWKEGNLQVLGNIRSRHHHKS